VRAEGWRALRHFCGWDLLLGAVISLSVRLFLHSNHGTLHWFVWEFVDLRMGWRLLLCFYLIEFGAYLPLLFLLRKTLSESDRLVLCMAVAILVVLPFYHLGHANDLVNKASTPAIFALAIILCRAIRHGFRSGSARRPAVAPPVLLGIGAIGSLSGLMAGFLTGFAQREASVLATAPHCHELVLKYKEEAPYMGSSDSFFWRHLARPLVLPKLP